MIDPTDADKARVCKVLGEFINRYPLFCRDESEDERLARWCSLGFFTSRDALWPVLQKLASMGEEPVVAFLSHLEFSYSYSNEWDALKIFLEYKPAQLALAAYKTIEEMGEVK